MITPLGEAFRKARSKTRTTQREMAKYLGISNCFLCEIEHGKENPSPTLDMKAKEFFASKGLEVDFWREYTMSRRSYTINTLPERNQYLIRRLVLLNLDRISDEKWEQLKDKIDRIEKAQRKQKKQRSK